MLNTKDLELMLSYKYEKEWYEFKTNFKNDEEIGEYISALSNSAAYYGKRNGYIIWGIDDKTHEIVGTNFDYDKDTMHNEPLKHFLARNIRPSLPFEFHKIEIKGKKLVVLEISAAKSIPTDWRGIRYIRIGSSKEKISKYPEREIYLFHVLHDGIPTITNTKSEYQDLTFNKLKVYYASKGISLTDKTFKKNLHLLTSDGAYNIQAQLLSDNSHKPLRVAIFDGETKASNLFSIREFGFNCLLYSLDELLRYGDVLNIIQADERDRIVERKEVSLFENEAFREALINAILHNKWIEGNEPMISVFSNRIEILSRGTLAPTQTIEGFFSGESIPVNEELSNIFLQLHISEKTGRGIPKIIKHYGKKVVDFRENSICVSIPFNWINAVGYKQAEIENKIAEVGNKTPEVGNKVGNKGSKVGNKVGNKGSKVGNKSFKVGNKVGNKTSEVGNKTPEVGNKVADIANEIANGISTDTSIIDNFLSDKDLTANMIKIMIEIYKNPCITGTQLKELVGVSDTSIDNNIKKLKNLGLLIRIGTKKIGYWSIVGIDK